LMKWRKKIGKSKAPTPAFQAAPSKGGETIKIKSS
jgi:hypothetical protein